MIIEGVSYEHYTLVGLLPVMNKVRGQQLQKGPDNYGISLVNYGSP